MGPISTPSPIRSSGLKHQRLRRALDHYYLTHGIEDPVRIDIPKGRYVPVFLDNHVTSEVPDSSECPSPVPAQTSMYSIEPAIAVFEFENLGTSDQSSFFAKGLTTEILSSLTRFSGLSALGPLIQAERRPIDDYKVCHEYGARFILKCIDGAKKVVAMNPNHPRILAGIAVAVTVIGGYGLGLELIERAKRLNPHFPSWYRFVVTWFVKRMRITRRPGKSYRKCISKALICTRCSAHLCREN